MEKFQIHKLAETETIKTFTYIVIDVEKNQVVAYFSLANDKISIAEFAGRTEFNRFRKKRFVNEKRIKSYPAVKLCRLAVANSARGLHIGSFLLDFIKSFFVDDNKTGCRFITVDAYLDAVEFYCKSGFEFLNESDSDARTRLLFFDLDSM